MIFCKQLLTYDTDTVNSRFYKYGPKRHNFHSYWKRRNDLSNLSSLSGKLHLSDKLRLYGQMK